MWLFSKTEYLKCVRNVKVVKVHKKITYSKTNGLSIEQFMSRTFREMLTKLETGRMSAKENKAWLSQEVENAFF